MEDLSREQQAMIAQETKGYSAAAKVLHWLMAALVEDGEVDD
jgi:hypothetical protein